MGVMGAFVFAAQMINFTIPGTGSSGHLCGGMLLTALLGPYAAFLTLIGVLLIQCLFFADVIGIEFTIQENFHSAGTHKAQDEGFRPHLSMASLRFC